MQPSESQPSIPEPTEARVRAHNAALAKRLWDAISLSDASAIHELLAEDVRWEAPSGGSLPRLSHGPDGVFDYLLKAGELAEELTLDLLEIYESPTGAAVRYRTRARSGTRELDTEVVVLLTIEDGLITHAVSLPRDAQANVAFWSST